MSRKGQRSWSGARRTGFESLLPDLGSLAHRAEQRCEEPRVRGSSPRGTTARLTSIVVMRQPSKLVSGVQFPGGALSVANSIGQRTGPLPQAIPVRVRGGVPGGSGVTGKHGRLKPCWAAGPCAFDSRLPHPMGNGVTRQHDRLWTVQFRFES